MIATVLACATTPASCKCAQHEPEPASPGSRHTARAAPPPAFHVPSESSRMESGCDGSGFFMPEAGGRTVGELLDLVSRTTNTAIVWDADDTTILQTRVQICFTQVVREGDVVLWLQSLLSACDRSLVPVAPTPASGKPQWAVQATAERDRDQPPTVGP